jgi:hypothetical protein
MRRIAFVVSFAVLAACAGAAPAPLPPAPPPVASASAPEPVASSAPPAESAPPPVASASVEPPKEEPSGPTSCPDGMVLVDGDYCTELEAKCLKSTYAKQNKKTICWKFEEPTKCIGKKEKRRYCIDKFEYPNKKGELPVVMNDFVHAQKICADQGKRMCTESEWTMACEGPSYKPYPYGYERDPNKCRGDRDYRHPKKEESGLLTTHSKNKEKAKKEQARLYDAVPSGSQPDCVSDYGVADMPGNADELASSEKMDSPYDNVTTGGPWVEGVRNQCRPKIYTHNEGFSYYYLSFRCCSEPDGKPTDPRSPKQKKRGDKWKQLAPGRGVTSPPAATPSA